MIFNACLLIICIALYALFLFVSAYDIFSLVHVMMQGLRGEGGSQCEDSSGELRVWVDGCVELSAVRCVIYDKHLEIFYGY